MRGFVRLIAACAAVAMVSACGGSDGGGGGGGVGLGAATFQGTWVSCHAFATSSDETVLVISGTSYTVTLKFHDDTTCADAGSPIVSDAGTLTFGSAVPANLNGSLVTAYQLDVNGSASGAFYDLGYVDVNSTPDRLYFGDISGANDGSTPALRPIALDGSFFLNRQ